VQSLALIAVQSFFQCLRRFGTVFPERERYFLLSSLEVVLTDLSKAGPFLRDYRIGGFRRLVNSRAVRD